MYSKTNASAGPALIRLLHFQSKARPICNLHENIRLVLVSTLKLET
jgi:hypothetical protein